MSEDWDIDWTEAMRVIASDLHIGRRDLKYKYQQDMWKMAQIWTDMVRKEKEDTVTWKKFEPKPDFIEESEMML